MTDTEPDSEEKTGMEKHGEESARNHEVNIHGRQDFGRKWERSGKCAQKQNRTKGEVTERSRMA